jgi:hypothetical protein
MGENVLRKWGLRGLQGRILAGLGLAGGSAGKVKVDDIERSTTVLGVSPDWNDSEDKLATEIELLMLMLTSLRRTERISEGEGCGCRLLSRSRSRSCSCSCSCSCSQERE